MLHVGRVMIGCQARVRHIDYFLYIIFFCFCSTHRHLVLKWVLVTRLAYFMCIAGVQLDIIYDKKCHVTKIFEKKNKNIFFELFRRWILRHASSSLKIT